MEKGVATTASNAAKKSCRAPQILHPEIVGWLFAHDTAGVGDAARSLEIYVAVCVEQCFFHVYRLHESNEHGV